MYFVELHMEKKASCLVRYSFELQRLLLMNFCSLEIAIPEDVQIFFFPLRLLPSFHKHCYIYVYVTHVLHVYVTQYPQTWFVVVFFFFLGGPVIIPREGKEKPFLRRNLVDLHPRKEIYGECKRNQPTKQQQQQTKPPPHPN